MLLPVKRTLYFGYLVTRRYLRALLFLISVVVVFCGALAVLARPQQAAKEAGPAVTTVAPPNWWVGLTPEVMLLLSGHDLQPYKEIVSARCRLGARHAKCGQVA